MDTKHTLPRSPELMSADTTALLVVDIQVKLVRHITNSENVVWNSGRLADAAAVLGIPVLATEQYPRGLGDTVPELADKLPDRPEKLTFSCGGCEPMVAALSASDATQVLLCGIESHVCVQQTAFDLMAAGYRVFVAADAVSSRYAMDHQTALRRMESAGATITTTESALFEWCERAGTPEFKAISQIVRETGPAF